MTQPALVEAPRKKVEMRVANSTDPIKLAWSIRKTHEEGKTVELCAVGVEAVNVSCKSVAVANGFLGAHGVRLSMLPFFDTEQDATRPDRRLTVVRFRLLAHD
jgi:stage V sporulation protein SpoVS